MSLVTLLALTAPVFTAAAVADGEDDREEEKKYTDYILIIACTYSANDADYKNIRAAAAKMFVDLLPVDNTRVAVFSIGEAGKLDKNRNQYTDRYHLRADDGHIPTEMYQGAPYADWRMRCVRMLWDLDKDDTADSLGYGIDTKPKRETLKNAIDKAFSTKSSYSDTHCAVYAALDTLKKWESENACILLVSDEFAAYDDWHYESFDHGTGKLVGEHSMWEDIEDEMIAHENWVMNWVNLNSSSKTGNTQMETIHARIKGICGEKRVFEDFAIQELPQRIAYAIARYIDVENTDVDDTDEDRFKKSVKTKMIGNNHEATLDLDPFLLLTEANVIVTGDGIDEITIIDNDGIQIGDKGTREDIWFSENKDPQKKDLHLYSAVKLIRPAAGKWTVKVKGTPGNTVFMQTLRTLEPDIAFDHIEDKDADGNIAVETEIRFTVRFMYAGEELHCGKQGYMEFWDKAKIRYRHSSAPNDWIDDEIKIIEPEGERYNASFTLSKKGTYDFEFVIESNQFRSGRCSATIKNITVDNNSPQVIRPIDDLTGHVDADLGPVNIKDCFYDRDKNDKLTYIVECLYKNGEKAGRDVKPEDRFWKLEEGFLSGKIPETGGEYEFIAYAEDTNGAKSEEIRFLLHSINDAPELKENQKNNVEIRRIANAPAFLVSLGLLPKDECKDYSVNLNNVFEDPEHKKLTFLIDLSEKKDDDEQDIVTVSDSADGTMVITAVSKGEAAVTVKAKDSAMAESEPVTYNITVISVGDALFARYWWVPIVIAVIILIILALLASRRVRGSWSISIQDNENRSACSHSFTSLPSSRDPRLKKTKVSLLSIVKCAVRKEDCVGDVQTNQLKDKVIVFKGSLALGKGVKFIYTPTSRTIVTLNDTVLTKSGKYILKKNQILDVNCKDVDDSLVLNVQASFH